ncbi:MAG: M1 family metallopeptidase [bacterium]|nr:M1 family metallopeptidase [bacterium]
MSRMSTVAVVCALVLAGAGALAQESTPVSPRIANYQIDVRLDPEQHHLEGRQVLEWRNTQAAPTDELWFHLYWNAWRNNHSTWMRGDRIRGRSSLGDDVSPEDWSYLDVTSATVRDESTGEIDVTGGMRFESPDDGNVHDRTVLVVKLPRAIAPGESVQLGMTWTARIPRTFARTGRRGDYYFIAHWFPKLGVYEPEGWNCHQFHSATEFFSDYGRYDVRITVPARFVVGATGRKVERTENVDGTATHRHVQDDVHAFTWTASPGYAVREARFEHPGLPAVDLRLLIQPEHLGQAERHLDATRAALEHYGEWYGAYPYGHVTVVDPAYGSGAGGMEYPTLFTCGTRLFNPFGGDSPESVTVHEAGHQFWYGLVGNNEFEHAWLDEGLNTFSTNRTLETVYPERVLVRRYLQPPGGGSGFIPLRYPGLHVSRWGRRLTGYRRAERSDIPSEPTFGFYPSTASRISYSKTALWLETLERHLGWAVLQRGMATFFERHRFGHPTPDDFFAAIEESAGQDLDWFFEQVHYDSAVFDYAVRSVSSRKVETVGYTEQGGELVLHEDDDGSSGGEDDPTAIYRTEVVVQRRGDGVFPVEVLLVFEDGHAIRESWDGKASWRMFAVERQSKLEHAVVDPERTLMLDTRPTNNSRSLESRGALPARKWGSKWMIWLQDLLATYSFYL